MKVNFKYFTKSEWALWIGSVILIIVSFALFDRANYLTLVASLIVLWTMATISDISYLSVIICFVMFLVNDLYGFINWKRMQKSQAK